MNDFLIKNALSILKFAPLVFLFNGYWMIDNRQIFDNVHPYINYNMETMKSDHLLTDFMYVSRHTPLQYIIFSSVFTIVVQSLFEEHL